MRLTLRTLLAYMDRVIDDPAQAAQLKKRVEESEFAVSLSQRIRHAVHRLRLGAPKVEGRGLGFDPNSVAEYLDNTLSPDRVGEYEKICLESDQHLAETAACHQILAIVLGEAAVVPVATRDRCRNLLKEQGYQVHSAHLGGTTAPVQKTPASEPVQMSLDPGAAPVIPGYMAKSPSRAPRVFLALLGLAAAAIMVVAVSGLLNSKSPLRAWLGRNQPEGELVAGVPSGVPEQPVVEVPPDQPINNLPNVPVEPGPMPPGEAPNIIPEAKPEVPPSEPMLPPAEAEKPAEKPIEKPAENPAPESPEKNPAVEDPKAPTKPAPLKAGPIGRFLSAETILARFDSAKNAWVRLPQNTSFSVGDRFVSLPVYRPQLAIGAGNMLLTAVGEGEWSFVEPEADEDFPIIRTDFGRFIVTNSGEAGGRIGLRCRDLSGVLSLSGENAAAAVEVYSFLPPGEDPELELQWTILHVFALSGEIVWSPAGGESAAIAVNHVRTTAGSETPVSVGPIQLPAWIDPTKTNVLDRESAKFVEAGLTSDRSLRLALEELSQHRRLDVRVHVARSLACIGSFETIIRHLSDEEYKSYWYREVDLIRAMAARGGDEAAVVKRELHAVRGRDGELLYRMLWGYSDQQLEREAAAELVAGLERADTDLRVLASDNLRRITGSTHSFQPGQSVDKNRASIVRWKKLLKDGEVKHVSAPLPYVPFRVIAPEKSKSAPGEKPKITVRAPDEAPSAEVKTPAEENASGEGELK